MQNVLNHLRRSILVFAGASVLLICISCGFGSEKSSGGDTASLDCDRSSFHWFSSFAKTNDTVFYMNGYGRWDAMLMYTDLKSGITGPLCGKPECLHDDVNCNASVPYSLRAFSFYNGKLYYVRNNPEKPIKELIITNPDGTSRRNAGSFDGILFHQQAEKYMGTFHRGYAFFSGSESLIEDGVPVTRSTIAAYKLDDLSHEISVYEGEKLSGRAASSVLIQPYMDDLYYMIMEWETVPEESPRGCMLRVYKWNLVSRNTNVLFEGDVDFIPYNFWVTDNEILCSNSSDNRIHRLDPKGQTIQEAFRVGDSEALCCAFFSENLVFAMYFPEEGESRVVMTDFKGKILLDQLTERTDYERNGRFFLGADGDNVYLHYVPFSYREETIIALNRKNGERTVLSSIPR